MDIESPKICLPNAHQEKGIQSFRAWLSWKRSADNSVEMNSNVGQSHKGEKFNNSREMFLVTQDAVRVPTFSVVSVSLLTQRSLQYSHPPIPNALE